LVSYNLLNESNTLQIGQFKVVLLAFLIFLGLTSCQSGDLSSKQDAVPRTTFNEDGSINAYIEIPAGSNVKNEMDKDNHEVKPEQLDGKERVIDFLPYPGNYGFIAGTNMTKRQGGDGDALDVLVLSDARNIGTAIKILPIGIILLEDKGEKDHKIIAVPFEESERTINVEKFSSFITKYNAAHFIVQEWFMNYKGLGQMKLLGWKDESYALKEIKKWSKDNDQ